MTTSPGSSSSRVSSTMRACTLPSSLKIRYALNFAMRSLVSCAVSRKVRLAQVLRAGSHLDSVRLRVALDSRSGRSRCARPSNSLSERHLRRQDELDAPVVELVHQPREAAHALRHARGGTAERPRLQSVW